MRLNRLAVRAEPTGDGVTLQLDNGETLAAQEIPVATGRRPNTDLLDVAATGVAVDGGGHVIVDEHQRSTVDGVFALGDMLSYHQLKHVANHEARVVQYTCCTPAGRSPPTTGSCDTRYSPRRRSRRST